MGEHHPNQADIIICEAGDRVCVRVVGEIDLSNAQALRDQLDLVLDHGQVHVVLDLTKLDFIDSSGLATLVPAAQRAREAGGGLVLVGVEPLTQRVLRLVPLGRHVTVAESPDGQGDLQHS